MALWEILFMLVLLKIPIGYVGYVVWWAVKAEPEVGVEGGTEGIEWQPWRRRRPSADQPPRGLRRGGPNRPGAGRAARQRAGRGS